MNKKVYIFLLMVLSLPLAIMAQTAVVVDGDHPFFDNFEGTACEWEFVNGESTNAWCWGTATSSGGPHSVYISQDGGETNTYNMSATTWVYFWKLVTLETASYRFTYDWKTLVKTIMTTFVSVCCQAPRTPHKAQDCLRVGFRLTAMQHCIILPIGPPKV